MTVSTTRTQLDNIRQFHQQVADYCARTAQLSSDERISMLLEYVGRHEQHLAEAIASYEKDGQTNVLNTWFRNIPDGAIPDPQSIAALGDAPSADDVINWAIKLDDAIIEFYKTLAAEAEIPELKVVLNNLLAMENREKLKMVRSALRINDI